MSILKDLYEKLFGKNYEPLWRQFAAERNGSYVTGSNERVDIIYKGYKIIFETYIYYSTVGNSTYEKAYTRARVEFKTRDQLNFLVTPQGLIESISKLFGSQDIIIGDKKFDSKFKIKGNDEYKVQLLFSNKLIKEALINDKLVRIEITEGEGLFDEKTSEGYSMLYYVSEQKMQNIEDLNKLLMFFVELIDALIKMGTIKEKKS